MPEPTRPEPDLPLTERLRVAVRPWMGGESVGRVGVVALIVVGAALLAGGSVWGWRAWSQRSAPPIDDLLPMLVGEPRADVAEPGDEGGEGGEAGRADQAVSVVGPAEPGVPPTASVAEATPAPVTVVVHVSGAVQRPGVVEVPAGSRVFEAVAASGGEAEDADLDRLNLAAPLVDGERIHVPAIGEGDPPVLVEPNRPVPTAGPVIPDAAEPLRVDLNRATVGELERLPGIGPTLAAAIVALRDLRGPYADVDELLLVDGIGPTKLDAIRSFVWVQDG